MLPSAWVSNETLRLTAEHIADIKRRPWEPAEHPDSKVQFSLQRELAERASISKVEIEAIKDKEGSREAMRSYYLKAIAQGQTFKATELRYDLSNSGLLFGYEPEEANPVVERLFTHLTYETLCELATQDSYDAPIAYRVLAEKHFEKHV